MILGFAPIDHTFEEPVPSRHLPNLQDALSAIYDGRWDDAEKTLSDERSVHDAKVLNLLGIVYQARRQWKQARRFYGRAMKADRNYAPAEQNLRRLYELHTFGRTDLPIALIDRDTAREVESRIAFPLMRQ
jgi:tetratricopeptide (TPR) repeat protein